MLLDRWHKTRDSFTGFLESRPRPDYPQRVQVSFETDSQANAARLVAAVEGKHHLRSQIIELPPTAPQRGRISRDVPDAENATMVFVEHRPQAVWRISLKGPPFQPLTSQAIEAFFADLEELLDRPECRFVGGAIVDERS